MVDFLFAPHSPTTIPIARGGLFAVRRVYCVGRNYAEHVVEMGNDTRDPPFFFGKPADAIVVGGADIPYPPQTSDFHHEIELVVAIGKDGADIAAEDALTHVYGYAAGLDMTRRDLQIDMREKKRPWDVGKSFAQAAPIGEIRPVASGGHVVRGAIRVDVNGARRQSGDVADMIWDVAHTLAFLSQLYELLPGDLVYTGTPSGVGPVVSGDRLDGHIDGLAALSIVVDPPR